MLSRRLRLALEQLCGIQQSGSSVQPIRKKARDFVVQVIPLAARFALELAQAGNGEELTNRVALFETLTAPSSEFDQAREAFLKFLTQQKKEPYNNDDERFFFRPRSLRTRGNFGPKGRELWCKERWIVHHLAEPNWARWHLLLALEDARRLLAEAAGLNTPAQVIEKWKTEIWSVVSRTDIDYLLGAHLLAECQQVLLAGDMTMVRYEALVTLLTEDNFRLVQVLQATAQFLCASTEDKGLIATSKAEVDGISPQVNRNSADNVGTHNNDAGKKQPWCHPPTDPKPDPYQHGPVRGKQKELARAFKKVRGGVLDPRQLHKLALQKEIWITRTGHEQCITIYFRDQSLFMQVSESLNLLRNPQKPAKHDNS